MAETVSALATRLGIRLGFKRTTTTEASRLQAAVISAIHQMLADGAPGIAHEVLSGETFGTLAVTVTHAAGASTGTTAQALTNVLPGDFLRAVDGNDYALYGVTFAGNILNFGAPIAASLTGAGTIYRRGIILPSGGPVTRVTLEDRHDLVARQGAAHMKPYETGTPELFEQHWDSTGERSVLMLYPASSSKERVLISQSKDLGALSSSSSIPWRDVALDAALRDAHKIWLTWTTGQNAVEAQMVGIAAAEGEAGRDNSSAGGPIVNG